MLVKVKEQLVKKTDSILQIFINNKGQCIKRKRALPMATLFLKSIKK